MFGGQNGFGEQGVHGVGALSNEIGRGSRQAMRQDKRNQRVVRFHRVSGQLSHRPPLLERFEKYADATPDLLPAARASWRALLGMVDLSRPTLSTLLDALTRLLRVARRGFLLMRGVRMVLGLEVFGLVRRTFAVPGHVLSDFESQILAGKRAVAPGSGITQRKPVNLTGRRGRG